MNANGTSCAYDSTNTLFYGWPGYASRVYQQYFWRYIIGRYGYATSIHSFELTNEGDPVNGACYGAAQNMANYFKVNDPNKHLVTTSLWQSYPAAEFWGDTTDYPDLGYADWHTNAGELASQSIEYLYPGWQGDISAYLDTTTYHSPPASLHLSNAVAELGNRVNCESDFFPVIPGHSYTLTWLMKGTNITSAPATEGGPYIALYPSPDCDYTPTLHALALAGPDWTVTGTYVWTQANYEFTVPSQDYYVPMPDTYLILNCVLDAASGDVWFDDISLHDDTAQAVAVVPNGGFDENRCDQDSAMYNYTLGRKVGCGATRYVQKPTMDPNSEIIGAVSGMTGAYSWEDPYLTWDTNGVWYRKFQWAQINPYGVISLYYGEANIRMNNLYRYAQAYQNFMRGIPLSNGNYVDATASVVDPSTNDPTTEVRAWGQKDLTNHNCHLWIDDKDSYWYNVVVNSVSVPQVTMNVSVDMQDLRSGIGYTVEFFDTQSGLSGQSMNPDLTNQMLDNGVLTFPVTLAADRTDVNGYHVYRTSG